MAEIKSEEDDREDQYFYEISWTKTKSFEYWLDKRWWNYITEYTPTRPTQATYLTQIRTSFPWPPFLGHSFDLGKTT